MESAREQLREIVRRRHDGTATYRADDTPLLVTVLTQIERARDAEAVPFVVDLWCARTANGLLSERLESIAHELARWRVAEAMGIAIAEPDSFSRFRAAFDDDLLQQPEGVSFANAILSAFSFVATRHSDGSITNPKFVYQPVAETIVRPEWLALLVSLRDHDDLVLR